MEENGLVEQKLGLFQRIRKNLFLWRLDSKKAAKYHSLPDYLKQDKDVAIATVEQRENVIVDVPFGIAKEIVKQNPKLINRLYDLNKINVLVNEMPELITNIEYEHYLMNLIYNEEFKGDRSFIKYLDKDLQKRLLKEYSIKYTYVESKTNGTSYIGLGRDDGKYGYRRDIAKYFKEFSEEAILEIALEEEQKRMDYLKQGRREYLSLLNEFDISSLPVETQLKLLLVSEQYMNKVSEEVITKYVNGNPLLFDKIPNKMKDEMVKANPELLAKMPRTYQNDFVKSHPDFYKNSTVTYGIPVRAFSSPDELKDRVILNGYFNYTDIENVTDTRNNDFIWEMGQFEPECVRVSYPNFSQDFKKYMKNAHLAKSFYEHAVRISGENELTDYLKSLENKGYSYTRTDLYTPEGCEKVNRIGKLVLNEDIVRKVPGRVLLDYAKEPTHEKLVGIIRDTYGDKSARILEDRPQIDLNLIPNLHMFKPEIVEEFGIGVIHANLSYTMPTAGLLSEFARKPELLEKYRQFNETTKDMFEDTASGFNSKLESFVKCKELMKSVDMRNLTDKQKEALQIAFMDSENREKVTVVDFPKDVKELDAYVETRNKYYDEAIKKEKNVGKLKELICKRHFGIEYEFDHHMPLIKPNVSVMGKFYNLDRFINDPITLQSGKFSRDELDTLEIIDIITKVNNPKALAELSSKLGERENVINPINVRAVRDKVPMQYSQELVNSLMGPEKAMEMVEQGVPGITMEEIDGVKVFHLCGADFKAYISNPFLGNSGIGVPSVEQLGKEWKEKENGISTISGCVVDQSEMTSCVSRGQWGLGFSNFHPHQIVGMGITDIHTSHSRRQLETYTTESNAVSYSYPEEFMKRVSRRLKISDPYNDTMHQYDEAALLRAEKELSEIKEGTYGGKVMPDFVFMYGKNSAYAVEQAKRSGIGYVFTFDEEAYKNKYREGLYNKDTEHTLREETELMKEVKDVVKGDNEDGR